MDIENVLTVLVSLIVGAGSSYMTFRLQFERFRAMDERRELDWSKWRDKIDNDIDQLKVSANVTELALLRQTLEGLVKRVEDLWKYTTDIKHLQVDPYVRATEVLKQRVDRMEKKE